MEENNNKKMLYKDIKLQTWILIISICLVILVVIGSSYAAFVWNDTGSNQTVSSGSYTIEIENTSGTTINLSNTYPMSDEEGKATTSYKFTISNNSNADVEFSLKLADGDTNNTINKEYLKVNLTGSNSIDVASLKGLPDNELDAGILSANSSKSYELRLWISNSAPNSTIGGQYIGKLTLDTTQIEQTGIDYPKGDVNMNGVLDFLDSDLVYDSAFHNIQLTAEQEKLADVDGDGTITAGDSREIFSQISSSMLSYMLLNVTLNNNPTFTTTSTDNGVFVQYSDGTRTKNGMRVYYYRGAVTNNYVSFAGQTWRVVRVNEDGTIRLITQNNITDDTIAFSTDNAQPDYIGSNIESIVNDWYENNIGSNYEYDSKVVIGEFCYDNSQESRSVSSRYNTVVLGGSLPRPIFKCPKGAVTVKTKAGIITLDELIYAGVLSEVVTNNTSYIDNGTNFWTMSPLNDFGYVAVYSSSKILGGSPVSWDHILYPRVVINLRADVTVSSGTGTSTDPYVIG